MLISIYQFSHPKSRKRTVDLVSSSSSLAYLDDKLFIKEDCFIEQESDRDQYRGEAWEVRTNTSTCGLLESTVCKIFSRQTAFWKCGAV